MKEIKIKVKPDEVLVFTIDDGINMEKFKDIQDVFYDKFHKHGIDFLIDSGIVKEVRVEKKKDVGVRMVKLIEKLNWKDYYIENKEVAGAVLILANTLASKTVDKLNDVIEVVNNLVTEKNKEEKK